MSVRLGDEEAKPIAEKFITEAVERIARREEIPQENVFDTYGAEVEILAAELEADDDRRWSEVDPREP